MKFPRLFRREAAPTTTVLMRVSVGDRYVAGQQYKIDPEEADQLILKGYAEGEVSREYLIHEVQAMRAKSQTIGL